MGVVSRRWVWLESIGVVSGCGYIDFLILLMPTPLVSALFCSSIPTFLCIKKNVFWLFLFMLFLCNLIIKNYWRG